MAATHRRSAENGRGRTWLHFRGCEPSPRRARASAVHDRDETALSDTAQIKWMLIALRAHHRGLTVSAAMRQADRDAGASARGRQELPAFIESLGSDRHSRLVARMRRLVLRRIVDLFRRVGPRGFSSAPQ
jgi:hypothetical protein